MNKSRLSDKIANGVFFTFSSSLFVGLIRLGTLAVIARLIAPEEFALMAAASAVIAFSMVVNKMGLTAAIIQKKELRREDVVTAQTVSLILSALLSYLVFQFSEALEEVFKLEGLSPYLKVASLIFVLRGVSALSRARAEKDLRFKNVATAEALAALVGYSLVVIPLALMGWGTWALVLAAITEATAALLILCYYRPPIIAFGVDISSLRALLGFGSLISLATVLSRLSQEIVTVVLSRNLPIVELGVFSRAQKLAMGQTRRANWALRAVLFPVLALIQSEPERLMVGYRRTITIVFFTTVIIALSGVFLSEHIILVILGPNWSDATTPFALLLTCVIPRSIIQVNASLRTATGNMWTHLTLEGMHLFVVTAFTVAGVRYGLVGAAVGVCAAYFVLMFIDTLVTLRLSGISIWGILSCLQPALIAVALLGACLALVSYLAFLMELNFWLHGVALAFTALIASAASALVPSMLLGQDGAWLRTFCVEKLRRLLQ